MKYCEKCNLLLTEERCSICGSKKTRDVENGDFCFLIECEQTFGQMLKEIFEKDGIKCALVPWGDGVRTVFALQLDKYRVYVPYEHYDKSKETVDFFLSDKTEKLKSELLENFDKWHMESERVVKKFRKKFKLGKEENVFEFVKRAIENAEQIIDRGARVASGHLYTIQINSELIWFDLVTFEISI